MREKEPREVPGACARGSARSGVSTVHVQRYFPRNRILRKFMYFIFFLKYIIHLFLYLQVYFLLLCPKVQRIATECQYRVPRVGCMRRWRESGKEK